MAEIAPQSPRRSSSRSSSRRRRRSSSRSHRSRLRLAYFALASVWGFLSGTVAVLVALASLDRPLSLEPTVAACLGIAAVASILGGYVAARAYREAAERRR